MNTDELARQIANKWLKNGGFNSSLENLAAIIREHLEPLVAERRNQLRDGNWLDELGACKVCDGEIPYGHTPNCDIFKLEQEMILFRAQRDSLRTQLEQAREAIKQALRNNGGPIDSDTTTDGVAYVMVRHEDLDALEAALTPAKQPAEG